MNKKGFTLTEILGAIIILGILVIIAVITFTGNMKGFREDYYTETVRTLTESGKEFFNDNRKYRPGEILQGQVVPISTLVINHYIDEIKDYNGGSCSDSSYVIVIKEGKDDYTYHTCLYCPEDEYSNMDDKYCDTAWTNSTGIEYAIETPPEIYIYKGTPKSTLKDKLAIKASYIKRNSQGEIIGKVDGTGIDEAPIIYPDDMDIVDVNTLGKYNVTYTYQEEKREGHVIVYEYQSPFVSIKKINTVAKNLSGETETIAEAYSSGEWAQKVRVSLVAGAVDAGGANVSSTSLSNTVHKFQWNKDGVWQDFCNGDDCYNIEVKVEMNESIKFRSVDVDGVASEESIPIDLRIDNTKPTCTITSSGNHIDNDEWYTGDVQMSFVKYEDLLGTLPEAVSGIKTKNITIETGELTRENSLTATHNKDTKGIKYLGFVEDEAQNFMICEVLIKRDVTSPECTLETSGTIGTNDWYRSSSVSTAFSKSYDATSGVREYGIGSYNGEKTVVNQNNTTGITYTGYIKDIAGNTSSCTVSYKKDSDNPTCGNVTYGDDSTSGVSVTITCNDTGGSNCTGEATTTNAIESSSLTIKDNAGNTKQCAYTVSNYLQHRDHDWAPCKFGNECVSSSTWIPKRCSPPGSNCDSCDSQETTNCWYVDAQGGHYGDHPESCSCSGGYYDTNPCASRTPCIGGYNDWSGYSNGKCTKPNAYQSYECEERTMYHGG